jgi:two-component system phosphate regulon sensor histidine kinase PhoR
MKQFPWRVFFQFVTYQIVFFSLAFLVVIINLGFFSDLSPREIPNILWLKSFLYFFGLALLVASLNAYRFSRPIQRTLYMARRLANKKQVEGYAEPTADLYEDEVGEYSELEQALNRIGKKLRKKKDQLQTEREENRAVMASVQEGLFSVSSQEKVLFFNSRFGALFIHQSLINKTDLSLSDVFRKPQLYEAFRRVLETKETQKITVKLNTWIDTQTRHFMVSLTPLRRTKNQEIYGVIGVFHDITDIKLAEKVRIDFVENASHELRTPLTSVKGYLDTAQEDLKSGQYQQAGQFLDIVSKNVSRLIELVNDLLSLSTLDSNAELRLEMMEPLQISNHIVSELASLAAAKNQVIRIVGDIPPFLADTSKVDQVLRNLVSNAIKYGPEGKTIQVRWESGGPRSVLLKVIDEGPGIPEEHHSRLFERFYRVDRGRSRDIGGTGLGLAIVKHIMLIHGGEVSVKSQPGHGSEFICQFPVKN